MTNALSFSKKLLAASVMMASFLAGATYCVAGPRGSISVARAVGQSNSGGNFGTASVQPFYGGYGDYYSPYAGTSSYSPGYAYAPNYWWTGAYPAADPRGIGNNPNAGYAWGSVTTLLLDTFPAQARVTLDGIFVGTADRLGPFQLPAGEHTLRVDAAGYEPSDTVLQVERPVLQQLQVRLTAVAHSGKPAPRP
jgi:hypothetical protein